MLIVLFMMGVMSVCGADHTTEITEYCDEAHQRHQNKIFEDEEDRMAHVWINGQTVETQTKLPVVSQEEPDVSNQEPFDKESPANQKEKQSPPLEGAPLSEKVPPPRYNQRLIAVI